MTLANKVTLIRILVVPLFLFFLLNPQMAGAHIIAAIIFALLAMTDYLDGWLARKRSEVTALGKFLDPLADKILICSALIGMVDLRLVSAWPVIIITAREFAVMGLRVSGKVLAASGLSKWKTVLQMVSILLILLHFPYSLAVLWLAVALSVISLVEYVW